MGLMVEMLLVLLICRRKRWRAKATVPETLTATVATVEAGVVVFLWLEVMA